MTWRDWVVPVMFSLSIGANLYALIHVHKLRKRMTDMKDQCREDVREALEEVDR